MRLTYAQNWYLEKTNSILKVTTAKTLNYFLHLLEGFLDGYYSTAKITLLIVCRYVQPRRKGREEASAFN